MKHKKTHNRKSEAGKYDLDSVSMLDSNISLLKHYDTNRIFSSMYRYEIYDKYCCGYLRECNFQLLCLVELCRNINNPLILTKLGISDSYYENLFSMYPELYEAGGLIEDLMDEQEIYGKLKPGALNMISTMSEEARMKLYTLYDKRKLSKKGCFNDFDNVLFLDDILDMFKNYNCRTINDVEYINLVDQIGYFRAYDKRYGIFNYMLPNKEITYDEYKKIISYLTELRSYLQNNKVYKCVNAEYFSMVKLIDKELSREFNIKLLRELYTINNNKELRHKDMNKFNFLDDRFTNSWDIFELLMFLVVYTMIKDESERNKFISKSVYLEWMDELCGYIDYYSNEK